MDVLILTPPPLIFIGGSHGQQGRFQLVILQEPTSRINEELPHRRLKSVGAVGWSADHGGRPWWSDDGPLPSTTPKFGIWVVLVSLVLIPWVMACLKLVYFGTWACFDPFQPDSHALIGCAFCLGLWSVFFCS